MVWVGAIMKDAALEFPINPYQSAGAIRFGMPAAQVRALLDSRLEETNPPAYRDAFDELGIRVHYAPSDAAEAIEFRGPAFPTFQGRRLLNQRYGDLEAWFASLDTGLKREHSGLTSLEFGIRLFAPSARKRPEALIEVVTVFEADYVRRYIMSIMPPPL